MHAGATESDIQCSSNSCWLQFPELRPGMPGAPMPQGLYMPPGLERGPHPPPPPPPAMTFNPAAAPFRAGGHPTEPQYMGAAPAGMQYGAVPMYPMVPAGIPPPGMPPPYQVCALSPVHRAGLSGRRAAPSRESGLVCTDEASPVF